MKYCIDCGKKVSNPKSLRCRSCSKKTNNNPMWKEDNVGCSPLHNWVRRYKPKPKLCEICKKNKPYDLANISGKYKRNINDFEWLCRKCHMIKDGRLKKLHNNNRRKHKGNLLQCTKCKEFKLKEQFYKNKHNWDGLDVWCKECIKKNVNNERKKRYYKIWSQIPEVKERRARLARENYQKNKEKNAKSIGEFIKKKLIIEGLEND